MKPLPTQQKDRPTPGKKRKRPKPYTLWVKGRWCFQHKNKWVKVGRYYSEAHATQARGSTWAKWLTRHNEDDSSPWYIQGPKDPKPEPRR